MSTLPFHTHDLGHGVYAVDTGFQREHFDAAYLVVDEGEAAFIDTGTNFAVPRLLEALAALSMWPEQVRWVIPTHVHLDHAGGVGLLMQALPKAQLLVHPRGARHMIDPSALYEGALAVYGSEEMARSYGQLLGVPAERVVTSHDEMQVPLGKRQFRLIDTPGHARHHHCIWDEVSRGWFTGDTFGISYREMDIAGQPWIFPTSTPVQFEPELLKASVQRLMAAQPACMYLTHYGRVQPVEELARHQLELLDQVVAMGLEVKARTAGADTETRLSALRDGLLAIYTRSLHQQGSQLTDADIARWMAMDIQLNAQGMAVWLDKLAA